ncbi:hypothetical protein Y032_0089g2242 [Ancylostoma ceylanicum]|uniref:Uncharacterized protein n=1 Tax=Ancylostoma ceylanicum TaxID=53326 RepID=A0A016TN22_9BILA|nr:hypothetical protein Y032_0089g2242 [Ancylostoma ceylanicum]
MCSARTVGLKFGALARFECLRCAGGPYQERPSHIGFIPICQPSLLHFPCESQMLSHNHYMGKIPLSSRAV